MRHELSDRALWLIGPLALLATYYLSKGILRQVKDATLAPPPSVIALPKKVEDDAEEHIPIDALRTLSDGHSFELRKAAFKIALSQSLADVPKAILLRDLAGNDLNRRDDAVFALWYLIHGPDYNENDYETTRKEQRLKLQDYNTYRALVTSLVNLLPLHATTLADAPLKATGDLPSPILPLHRPTHESNLIHLILELLRSHKRNPSPGGGIPTLLKAGIIKRWLTHYPFPCTLPAYAHLNFKRSDVAELFTDRTYARDDYVMSELFRNLSSSPAAQQQLREAGLATRSSSFNENFRSTPYYRVGNGPGDRDDLNPVRRMLDDLTAENIEPSAWQVIPPVRSRSGIELVRPRSSDRNEEDDRIRRRHREAVVVADRGVPISNQNILQRVDSSAPMLALSEHPRRGQAAAVRDVDGEEADADPEDAGEGEGDLDNASHLSFSEVGGNATPDSMPSLMDLAAALTNRHQRLSTEELGRRIGAVQAGVGGDEAVTEETSSRNMDGGDG